MNGSGGDAAAGEGTGSSGAGTGSGSGGSSGPGGDAGGGNGFGDGGDANFGDQTGGFDVGGTGYGSRGPGGTDPGSPGSIGGDGASDVGGVREWSPAEKAAAEAADIQAAENAMQFGGFVGAPSTASAPTGGLLDGYSGYSADVQAAENTDQGYGGPGEAGMSWGDKIGRFFPEDPRLAEKGIISAIDPSATLINWAEIEGELTPEQAAAARGRSIANSIADFANSRIGRVATIGAGFLGGPTVSAGLGLVNAVTSHSPVSELGSQLTGKAIGTIAGGPAMAVAGHIAGETGSLVGATIGGTVAGAAAGVGMGKGFSGADTPGASAVGGPGPAADNGFSGDDGAFSTGGVVANAEAAATPTSGGFVDTGGGGWASGGGGVPGWSQGGGNASGWLS